MASTFDINVLNELQELLEDDFYTLIETYLRDVRNKVPQLKQFVQAKDIDALVETAHSLKGASINLGVTQFSEQCRDIEMQARSKSHVEISQMVEQASLQASDLTKELSSLYLK